MTDTADIDDVRKTCAVELGTRDTVVVTPMQTHQRNGTSPREAERIRNGKHGHALCLHNVRDDEPKMTRILRAAG